MNILIVAPSWPWPVRKGYQSRALGLASLLTPEHAVTLLAPAGEAAAPRELPFTVEVARATGRPRLSALASGVLGGRPLQQALFENRDLERQLRRLVPGLDRVVLLTSRLSSLAEHVPREALVVDLVDSLALNFERRALFDRLPLRPLWRLEARRLRADERRLVAQSRVALLVAERDRDHLARDLSPELARRLAVVPLVLGAGPPPPTGGVATGSPELLLTGNLGYFPTVHGALWLVEKVWPSVRASHPRARLILAGSRPASRLARRAIASGAELSIEPPSFAADFARAAIAVVPLFAGSGSPMKLLEAIVAGTPVVATPAAANGTVPAIQRGLTIAESAGEWISALEVSLDDPQAARRRATIARAAALQHHAAPRVRELLLSALG